MINDDTGGRAAEQPDPVKLHVVNRVSGEGFIFEGSAQGAVMLRRYGDSVVEAAAWDVFARDYQATCSHFYGQWDSCPCCDASPQ